MLVALGGPAITKRGQMVTQERTNRMEAKDFGDIGAASKTTITRRDLVVGAAALVATIGLRSTAITTETE